MLVECLDKKSRQELKRRIKSINQDITFKIKNYKGYNEPKSLKIIYDNIQDISTKLKAQQSIKGILKALRYWQYCRVI